MAERIGVAMAAEENKKEGKTENKYTKEQILLSYKYAKRRDLLNALLDDGKEYTLNEVDSMMDKFLKGKVTG